MPYYAQIDQDNKCIAISQLKENNMPNLILLNNYSIELIGAVYNKENQTWNIQEDNDLDDNLNETSDQITTQTLLPQVEEVEIGPTQLDKMEIKMADLEAQ